MADIKVSLRDAPSTAGLTDISRGATPRKAQEFAVDNSAAMKVQGDTLLVNMGSSLFDTAMKGADNLIKQDINDTTTQAMDQIYSEFGVDSALGIEGKPAGSDTPPGEIKTAEDNLSRLSQARARGTISENSYWSRVESVSRQLRARYPGHRDYIDQRISSVSGGKPANEIVRNIMQEGARAAAASSAGLKQRDQLAEQLAKEGILPPDWEKMDHHQLINASIIPLKQKAQLNFEKSAIELAKSRNEATGELTATAARTMVSNYVTDAHGSLINGMPEYQSFVSSMTDAAKKSGTGTLDDTSVTKLRTDFNVFRTKFLSTVEDSLNNEFGGTLTEKQREDAISPAVRWLNNYETALVNKDYGYLVELSHRREAMKSSDEIRLLSNFPTLRANATINNTLGEIASNTYLEYSTQLVSPKDKALFSEQLTRLWTDPNYSVNDALHDNKAKGMGKEANTATIMAMLDNLQNPNIKPEATLQIAKSLYGERNASMLSNITDPSQRLSVYSRMVNPTIFSRIKQLKDQGYTQIYDNYIGWAEFNFSNISRNVVSDFTRKMDASGSTKDRVRFNPSTGTFSVDTTGDMSGLERGSVYNLSKAADTVNTTFRAILPIMQDKGVSPGEFVQQVFSGLGVDTTTIQSGMSRLGGEPQLTRAPALAPKRIKPGQQGQVTPQQGDSVQMEELSSFVTQKRQDLQLYNQMITEDPNNSQAIDLYEKTLLQWSDAIKELNSLSQQWLEEFSRRSTDQTNSIDGGSGVLSGLSDQAAVARNSGRNNAQNGPTSSYAGRRWENRLAEPSAAFSFDYLPSNYITQQITRPAEGPAGIKGSDGTQGGVRGRRRR